MKTALLALASVTISTGLLQAQGTFQNLDFESAQVVFEANPFNAPIIAVTNALPGWSAFQRTNQLTTIPYGIGGSLFAVTLVSQTNVGSIDGFFSVVIGGGSITQSGLVPDDAQTLLFKIAARGFDGPVTVSLGGQDLSYVPIFNALNYTLYGADISSFAGQVATLSFTGGQTMLDDIQFSTIPVPEPSAISLLCLGTGVWFYVRKHGRFRL